MLARLLGFKLGYRGGIAPKVNRVALCAICTGLDLASIINLEGGSAEPPKLPPACGYVKLMDSMNNQRTTSLKVSREPIPIPFKGAEVFL